MFDYQYSSNNNDRKPGALEISMRAHEQEKEMALFAAEFKAQKSADMKKTTRSTKGLLASLLSGIRLF